MSISDEKQFSVEATARADRSEDLPRAEVSALHTERGGSGGAAMAGGQRFQAQVTAWWAARVLLQTQIGQPYGLPAVSVAERIYCETRDSIDDVRIEVSNGERIFGQCKKSLNLSTSVESEWASVLSQFYGELVRPAQGVERRFVLFYERHNGNLEKLKTVLDRYRQLPAGTPIIEAGTNESEREIINDLNSRLDAMQSQSEFARLVENREDLLRHAYIKQLRLGNGEPDYLGISDALKDGLLTNPTQTTQTLHSLHRLADDLLADRGSVDRQALRERLLGEGIALRDSVDFRADFEKLENWSSTELASHEAEGRTRLVIGSDVVTLNRPVVAAMVNAALRGSYIVAGSAGSGKTGCVVDLTNRLRDRGLRVWYWAADSLPAHSAQEMATHLQLEHAWAGILADAATGAKPVIVVDGLDGLRDTRAQVAYRKFFALAKERGFTVIASIRAFDLQYSVELEELFPRTDLGIPQEFTNPALYRFCHISVAELGVEEFLEILRNLPQVLAVLKIAPQLLPVVFNLFSLDLLCKLISDGELVDDLTSISTQAELFERYWQKRIASHPLREELTQALSNLVEQLTNNRTLQVVPATWSGEVKTALFSAEIVRHPNSAPGRLPEERLVEFNHHLLFDYAAELLFVRPRREQLPEELASADTWGLFLRPSLLLFWRYVWKNGRLDFWHMMLALERGTVPTLHKLPGYMAVAEAASTLEDLQPIIDGSLSEDSASQFWLRVLKGAVATASFMSLPGFFNEGRGDFWLQFAQALVITSRQDLINEGQWLLLTASRFFGSLSENGKRIFNQTSIILRQHYTRPEMQASHVLRFTIEWICLSAEVNRDESIDALREAITTEEIFRFGHIQAYAVAHEIDKIWALSPELAVDAYDAIFGYVETDTSQVRLDNSLILGFTAAKNQEYEMAQHLLTWKFGDFMSAEPRAATQAMIKVMRHYRDQDHPLMSDAETKTFTWNGRECRFQPDHSSIWDVHDYDDPQKIANSWKSRVSALVRTEDGEAKWNDLCAVVITDNEMAVVWRKILFAGASAPEFFASRTWTILTQPVILVQDDIEEAVRDCIQSFTPHLSDEDLNEIQAAVLNLSRRQIPYIDDDSANRRLTYLKIKFLLSITDERRSPSSQDFLSSCDPQLLSLFERRIGNSAYDFEPTPFRQFEEAASEAQASQREREVLNASAPFMNLVTNEITDDLVADVLQGLHNTEMLLDENRGDVSPEVAGKVESRLLLGWSVVAASDVTLSNESAETLFNKFRGVLTEQEGPTSEGDHSFDPYRLAAKGVLGLAKKVENLPEGSDEVLNGLANDNDSSITLLFAERIWTLFELRPAVVWNTLESWIQILPAQSGRVEALRAALRNNWFWFLRNCDSARADGLLFALWQSAHNEGGRDLRVHSSEWIMVLWIKKQEESALTALRQAISSPMEYMEELWGIERFSRFGLFPGEDEPDFLNEAEKLATSQLLVEALTHAKQAVDSYLTQTEDSESAQTPPEPPDRLQSPGRMFSDISVRIRFAAKRFSTRLAEMSTGEVETEMASWWSWVEPILDILLSIPHPSFAFNLVEGLEHLIRFDFKKALHWISRATTASAPAGFAGESLAQGRVMDILERTLADHRVSLADDPDLRSDFLQTLEAFLAVGDPRALSLATKLDSIYR